MKKTVLQFVAVVLIATSLSSCATVFGGPVSACQRTKPAAGQPARAVRGGALVYVVKLI
jgi:hypothetical protein